MKIVLTQEYLKECLTYDPETGNFIWKERPSEHFKGKKYDEFRISKTWNSNFLNKKCGSYDKDNYLIIKINSRDYKAHRLAFLYMEGYMPENIVDHIDRNPSNNKWSNLRHVTRRCNNQNCDIRKDSKTGVTGVTIDKRSGKWHAYIRIDNKLKNIGYFDEFDSAVMARYEEEQENDEWSCSSVSSSFNYLKENNLLKAEDL